jgi:hypothetical protein
VYLSASFNSGMCQINNIEKMKCKTIHKNLIFFLESELPENEMEQIRNHLSGCKECSIFAEEMIKTFNIISEEKSPDVNPFFYTRLKTRLETQSAPKKLPFWQPVMVKVVQPVFFTLLLVAGIYGGIKVGTPVNATRISSGFTSNEIIPYLNEMQSESIEIFLME